MADYDYIATRNEILQRAFRIVGALPLGEPMSAEQLSQGVQALQQTVKSWQSKRIYLWTLVDLNFTLTVGLYGYTAPVTGSSRAIWAVDKAWLRSSSTIDTPLEVISYRQYNTIEDKTKRGTPQVITVNNQTAPTIFVYPVPDRSVTIFYTGIATLKDFDNPTDTGDFPARFQEALVYDVASKLADEYGLPLGERQYLAGLAAMHLKEASDSDRERMDTEMIVGAYR